jgi:predicted metalloprotease with PDZ domain
MAARIFGVLIAALFMTHAVPAGAQTAARPTPTSTEPIRYSVSFPAPQTHYVEVSMEVPTDRRPRVELMMAVWTPGSYLVREYARHVEAVAATGAGGRTLSVVKSDKNRWTVETGGAPAVTVKYRVYAREMSVRTNWVEAGFAMLNGAPTFMTLPDGLQRPHEVVITPARGWRRSITALPEMGGGDHRYRAPDFDTLVDAPILVGNPAVYEFTIDGKRHLLVNEGEAGVFDGQRAAKDVETLIRAQRDLWGSLPYERYVVMNVLTAAPGIAGGGLEHKDSTLLIASRWATRTRQPYLAWLELVSHEVFHAWNVKRLRPAELGPFDYENENFTRSLWMAEGLTDYYADLLVHRAGLSSRDEYLRSLSAKIEELQTNPGRLVQSASQASFDAWIKYYRPDENSVNVAVSYYTKGAVVAFLLDARIRAATSGARSLDDVVRLAYERFAGPRGYTPEEFRAVAEQVAGTSLERFWASNVDTAGELDYTEALRHFGLRFRASGTASGRPYLGANTRNDAGRLVVTQVLRNTPAFEAGLNVDDEILAIGEFRVRADQLNQRLDQYKAGDTVTLLVARREHLNRIEVTLGKEPQREWRVDIDPEAAADAQRQRDRWLQTNGSASTAQ